MNKNFGLTENEFSHLRDELKKGDEKIFEHIFLSHFGDCIKYLKRKYSISHTLAYDVTMDTMLEFRKKLIQDKISYGNLRYLFTCMAGQFYLKIVRANKKNENLTSLFENENLEEDFKILDKAILDLGENCIKLLKQNIYDNIDLKEIAQLYGKSAVAVRKQKQRCINRLKILFSKHEKSTTLYPHEKIS